MRYYRFTRTHSVVKALLLNTGVIALMMLYPSLRTDTMAQNAQYTNEAIDIGMRSSQRVNPITRAVEFTIPLGHYRGRGGFDVPVTLSYSSKVWGVEFQGYNTGSPPPHPIQPFTIVSADYAKRSVRGWTTTIGLPLLDFLPGDRIYNPDGSPNVTGNCTNGCYKVDRMMVWMPDGSGHELRASDQPRLTTQPAADNYYAVDGSRIRYQRSTGTLFFPDGSTVAGGVYKDRNGNTLNWLDGVTDTLNREIDTPLPYNQGGGPLSPVDQSYTLPGVAGTTLSYTLKWRKLQDVLTTPQPLKYIADSGCPPGTGVFSPNLFVSDSGSRTCFGNAGVLHNPVVLSQIILPNGQSYTFSYDIYGAIEKIVLPTGGHERYEYAYVPPISSPINFKFVYAQVNRGVTRHIVSHSGLSSDEAQWLYSGTGSTVSMTAPDGSRTESYLWTDGGSGWGYSADSSRAGRPYDERVYSPTGQMLRRKLTEWVMTPSNASGNPSGTQLANRNARIVRQVDIMLDTAAAALAKTTTYGYDTTFQYDVGVEQTSISEFDYVQLDQNTAQTLAITSLDLIPNGILLRKTETDYLTTDSNYRLRNLLGLPTATRIKDAAGNIVSQTSYRYDEPTFPVLTYDSVVHWTDPGNYRGNVTSSSRWLNFDGTTYYSFPQGLYLEVHTQYDQCGSVRKLWDARDTALLNPTLIEYSATFHRAYATSITTADPDSDGPLSALVTSTEYDLATGRVLANVDANLQRTTYTYDDPLSRLKQVVRAALDPAAKNQTTYVYDDVGRTVSSTSDLITYNDNLLKTVTVYDGLGRISETRQYENATDYIVTQQRYDAFGRAFKQSNPFRPSQNETAVWTTTGYDPLSRVISVTTPDNSVVSTVYAGSQVLVTDQNQRQRLTQIDVFGRVAAVWEITSADSATEAVAFPNHPEVTAGYVSRYSFDLLGNLISVTQRIGTSGTTQTRTFNYDSLSRLASAAHPESGTISYRYDKNGNLAQKTDSRVPAVTTSYVYDSLNRVISKTYSDSTPAVTYVYDAAGVANSKGRLTSTSTSISTYSHGGYDPLGRLLSSKQTTDGQTYTMTYGYDLAGNLTSQGYPSGRIVTTEYDNASRIAGVKNQSNGVFYVGASATDVPNRIQYSAHGAVSKMKFGNGLCDIRTSTCGCNLRRSAWA